jgi:hypothetical protein
MLQRWIRTGRLRGCQRTKFGGKIASVFLEGTVELGTLATPRVAAAAVILNPCRIARFIEVLRQANGIIAGITGMRWRRLLAFNAFGAASWVGTWVSLGYLAGSHIDAIYHDITRYSTYVLIALAALLAAYIARHVLRHRRRRATPAREPASAQQPDRRPSASETTGTKSAASLPTQARQPHLDS